jgi:hypothetical protein
MGRLEFASPREAWGGEAESFTPLLAEADMLEYLGAETGIGPLTLVETEHATAGSRSLDILAETIDGRRVSIENQYNRADHDHLTRGLAYAVATNSRLLVIIAEDHRDEFVSVADYLNDLRGQSDSAIAVWLVKVRAVRRKGDSVWSPEFVVQAEPNEWEASIRRATSPNLASLEDFYRRCEDETDRAWSETARSIVEDWLRRPNTAEGHNSKNTVSLFYPSPRHQQRGTNVLQLEVRGAVWIPRGHILRTSGVYGRDDDPSELDDQIRTYFPTARWPPKKYHVSDTNTSLEQVSGFADWLTHRFDVANEDSHFDGLDR